MPDLSRSVASAKTVKIPKDWIYGVSIPETTVRIYDDGAVFWTGLIIGYVWKGERTYSPPTHKGSRIVRYHKQVAEWQGSATGWKYGPDRYRCDTRQAVIQRLLADAIDTRGKS